MAHSAGGLITTLWLDRRRRTGGVAPIAGLVLNSPWLDLHGSRTRRGPVTWLLRPLARIRPLRRLDLPQNTVYSSTIHKSGTGEWEYDLSMKPAAGFPITIGWLNAVRRGHARVHRGLEVGVPTLVLHSGRTHFSRAYGPVSDRADTILDVKQIARWAARLGRRTTITPVEDARHDVFLSLPGPRAEAYQRLNAWLADHLHLRD